MTRVLILVIRKVLRMAGNKENMKQAMKELLGLVGIGSEGGKERRHEEEPPVEREIDLKQEQQEVAQTMEKGFFKSGASQPEEKRSGGFFHREEEPPMETVFPFSAPEHSAPERPAAPGFTPNPAMTVISAGTSMFGDIRAEGTVEVHGKLKGNLEATGNVRVTGKVLGDVKGDCVELVGCAVQGNITAAATLHIDASTIVVGDIVAADLVTDGKVKGSVQVEHSASFQKNAVLAGNVTAALVSMSEGAKIQGTVRISEDSETNALFGDKLEI